MNGLMPDLIHVVIYDPTRKRPAGSYIRDTRELGAALALGVVVLPVDDDLIPQQSKGPLDGYVIGQWGNGWLVDHGAAQWCCPMAIRVLPGRVAINWVARIQVARHATEAKGRFRLVGDSNQPGFMNAGLAHIQTPDLLENLQPDTTAGWTLRGCSLINVINDGLLALSLHGVAKGARVMWSAASLSSLRVEG